MSEDELWADLDAAPFNLWINDPLPGAVWCDTCQLPSALRYPVSSDPATDTGSYLTWCENRSNHPDAEESA